MKKPLPESFLPLKPHWFHVLLSLSNQDQHGYGIMQEVLDRTAGRLSDNATAAADKIAKLAREAASESVQLQAARAVLAELMTVSNFLAIERRLDELERRVAHAQPR